MTKLSDAAAALGRKGGKAKVPKGFAKKSPNERSAAGRSGMMKRWGKRVRVSIDVEFLPRDEQSIIDYAKKHCGGDKWFSPDGEDLEYDVLSAINDILIENQHITAAGLEYKSAVVDGPEPITGTAKDREQNWVEFCQRNAK